MPELEAVETPKKAGFVQRGSNYAIKQERIKQEEEEIAKLEAQARGEEVKENEPDGKGSETTEVQAEDSSKQEEANPEVEAQEDDSDLNPEEKSFKKRYGDLRRHMSDKEKEWNEKLKSLENRMKGESIVPPKSDEDITEWSKKYPDVAGIVEAIADKKSKATAKDLEARMAEFEELRITAKREKAEAELASMHPDFVQIREDDAFHKWAEVQPKWVQDALYENTEDAKSVSRVIDLYKVDTGIVNNKSNNSDKAAASSVKTKGAAKPEADEASKYIRESQVAAMSIKEYEKRQEEILDAQRNGRFIYDMSRK